MKATGLDGKVYAWNLQDRVPTGTDSIERSGPHLLARKLLHELYPLERILEEVSLPGSGKLEVDFYIPQQRLFVEVHGRQHYEFVPYFHTDKWGFIASKKRDKKKRDWAELNDIILVELPSDATVEEWRYRIVNR